MAETSKPSENNKLQQLEAENAALREEVNKLKDELVRLISRNLDLTERFENDVDLRRRVQVAREIFNGNIERQRNADLQDRSVCAVCSTSRPSIAPPRLISTISAS